MKYTISILIIILISSCSSLQVVTFEKGQLVIIKSNPTKYNDVYLSKSLGILKAEKGDTLNYITTIYSKRKKRRKFNVVNNNDTFWIDYGVARTVIEQGIRDQAWKFKVKESGLSVAWKRAKEYIQNNSDFEIVHETENLIETATPRRRHAIGFRVMKFKDGKDYMFEVTCKDANKDESTKILHQKRCSYYILTGKLDPLLADD